MKGAMEYENRKEDVVQRGLTNVTNRGWVAPMEGDYKINTDAAMFEGSQVGLGGVVRDFEGDVVVAMCNKVAGTNDVATAEALSARQGVQVALEAGFSNLILEVDNLRVYKSLQE